MTKPKAIICDLDGTLCDHRHRLHFIEREVTYAYPINNGVPDHNRLIQVPNPKAQPDYESFYAAMGNDKPYEAIKQIIISLWQDEGIETIFITGRPERFRDETAEWIEGATTSIWAPHTIERQNLFMRPDYVLKEIFGKQDGHYGGSYFMQKFTDYRPACEVKREIYEREIAGKYDVMFVLEDDEKCALMYKDLGLTVLKVMQ